MTHSTMELLDSVSPFRVLLVVIGLVLHVASGQECLVSTEVANELDDINVSEDIVAGTVVWSYPRDPQWIDLTTNLDGILEAFVDDEEVGLMAIGTWTDFIDCTTDVVDTVSNTSSATIYQGISFIYCEGDIQSDNLYTTVNVDAINNRKPGFLDADGGVGGNSYTFTDISKEFPTEVILSLVYPEVFVNVQDIDHIGDEPVDNFDSGTVTIAIQDDTEGLISLQQSSTTSTNPACSGELGNKELDAIKLDFAFARSPVDVLNGQSEYTFTITTDDGSGNQDSATVTLTFAQTDSLPPVFQEQYYYSDTMVTEDPTAEITDPVPLAVLPDSIIAVDGDGIDGVSIEYSLDENLQCSDSFNLTAQEGGGGQSTGSELQWVSNLSEECQALDQIFLVAVATQSGDGVEEKSSEIPVTVNMPGNLLNPVFTPTSYTGTVDEDGNVVLDGGLAGVSADGGDIYLPDAVVTYEISLEESTDGADTFSVDPDTGVITVIGQLPSSGSETLMIRGSEVDKPERNSLAPVYLTYTVGTPDPPVFANNIYSEDLEYQYQDNDNCKDITVDSALNTNYEVLEWYPPEYSEYFTMDNNDGIFSCLSLPANMNSELPDRVVIAVEATNGDGNDKTTVVFNLNGQPETEAPSFAESIYDDAEPLDAGYGDTPQCYSVSVQDTAEDVTYVVADTSPTEYDGKFTIDENNGQFTCMELDPDTALDETVYVTVVVEASNGGGSDETAVIFTLLPVVAPVFTESIYEAEPLDAGYPDTPQCAEVVLQPPEAEGVTYAVVDTSPDEYDGTFVIDATTGEFTCMELGTVPDETERVTVVVEASNEGGSDETSVVFTLLPDDTGVPSLSITSGDFEDEVQQTVGYPSFIYLESFIPQPLGSISISGYSLEEATFTLSGPSEDLLYIDDLGYVFPFRTEAESIDELCGDQCQVNVVADVAGVVQDSIDLIVMPLEEDYITALEILDDATSEEALAALNALDDTVWFREIQYLPTSDSSPGPGRDSENVNPVLLVTAMSDSQQFLTTDDIETMLDSNPAFSVDDDLGVTNIKDDTTTSTAGTTETTTGTTTTGTGTTGGTDTTTTTETLSSTSTTTTLDGSTDDPTNPPPSDTTVNPGGEGTTEDDGGDDNTALLASTIVLAILLVLVIAGAAWYIIRMRRRYEEAQRRRNYMDDFGRDNNAKSEQPKATEFTNPLTTSQTPQHEELRKEDSVSTVESEVSPPPAAAVAAATTATTAAVVLPRATAVAADKRPPAAAEPKSEIDRQMDDLRASLAASSKASPPDSPTPAPSILKINGMDVEVASSKPTASTASTAAAASTSASAVKPMQLDKKISFDSAAEVIRVPKEEKQHLEDVDEESTDDDDSDEDEDEHEGVAKL